MLGFRFALKRWRWPKVILGLMAVELLFVVGLLTLFGIAEPDTYRSKLWRDGFTNGFNSSPSQPLYDLVNGKTKQLQYPLVWSPLYVID